MHVMTCKSGYDHVSLHPLAERYLHGLSWNDCYFVYTTLPFGWKASAFVYHSIGLLAILATCIRSLGVPCTQYIDDRHIGQLVTPNSYPWSDLQKVEAAAYIATSIVIGITRWGGSTSPSTSQNRREPLATRVRMVVVL